MPHAMALLAGRYRLDSRIAVGGMGEVWRGTDTVLSRPVAVKLLRTEYAQYPETLARFRSEGRHAGSLSHPAIARIYDYGEDAAEHLGQRRPVHQLHHQVGRLRPGRPGRVLAVVVYPRDSRM